MKKGQSLAVVALVIGMIFFGMHLNGRDSTLALFLITGLILGYILTRSRFGFAGGIKKIYLTGDGSLTKAILLLFAISIVGAAGVHYGAMSNGAEVAARAGEGIAVIPGSQFVKATSLLTMIGGLLFGMGMVIGGGCASGTLTDAGEGATRAWIVGVFFSIGALIGHWMLPKLSALEEIATPYIYLPDYFGYVGAVVVSLLGLLALYIITKKYESSRSKAGTLKIETFEGSEKPIERIGEYKFLSEVTYHKFFVERWSFAKGSVLISIMFIFILTTTGSSWGASGPFTHWGVWALQKFGFNFSSPAFEGVVESVNAGLMNNASSIRNVGIVFGSAIAFLMAGRFKFDFNYKLQDAFFYALGGFLMGFGAKVGRGCNIGGLYSGIANFSLSGWLFMLALAVGGVIGLKLFAGKVDTAPEQVS